MTVSELICVLKKYDPNLDVYIPISRAKIEGVMNYEDVICNVVYFSKAHVILSNKSKPDTKRKKHGYNSFTSNTEAAPQDQK